MNLSSSLILVIAIAMAFAFTSPTTAVPQGKEHGQTRITLPALPNRPSAFGGMNPFFPPFQPIYLTCDRNPRVCHYMGSQGPNCCKMRCVNIETDYWNCGQCGKRCKYSEACCGGVCVNLWFDQSHCGRCGNGCGARSSCSYGLCDYA